MYVEKRIKVIGKTANWRQRVYFIFNGIDSECIVMV